MLKIPEVHLEVGRWTTMVRGRVAPVHRGTLGIKRVFKPRVATYFLVNIFLYHKTIKFGTVVIPTQGSGEVGSWSSLEAKRGIFRAPRPW